MTEKQLEKGDIVEISKDLFIGGGKRARITDKESRSQHIYEVSFLSSDSTTPYRYSRKNLTKISKEQIAAEKL